MAPAVALDGRRGPIRPEFEIPRRAREEQRRLERQSPLPEEWSEGTRSLRELGQWLDDLLSQR